jgi:DNA-binding MarR family transcriptional regulator
MVKPAAQDPSPGDTLERAVSALLRWVTRPDVRRSLLSPEGHNLSTTDTWLLGRVTDRGRCRVSDLAAWQGVDKSTMTAQVQRLERHGLVSRRRDEQDRRVVLVEATPAGRAVHEKNKRAARDVVDALVADWPKREQAELVRLLNRLIPRLEGAGALTGFAERSGEPGPG